MAVHDHMALGSIFSLAAWPIMWAGNSEVNLPPSAKPQRSCTVSPPFVSRTRPRFTSGGELHVLEILARAGDEEVFALQRRAGKARGNLPQNLAVHRIGCFAMIAYLEVAPTNDNSCFATSIFVGKSILTLHIGIITF